MICIYSYRGFTISQDTKTSKCSIIYPNEKESSVYCFSLDSAFRFIDEMKEGEIK